jgi:hypothetical protein
MRLGRPVNQRNYPTRYNPIQGRRSLMENVGPFKESSRYLLNKPIPKSLDSLRFIAGFLKKFNNKPQATYQITKEKGVNYITIGDDLMAKHKFIKTKNYYYLLTKKDYHPNFKGSKQNNNLPIKIKASNDAEFKEKLGWILTNPTSRAKLDYTTPKLLVSTDRFGEYMDFNEDKVVGNFQINQFENIGNAGTAEAFDSEIGSMDIHRINAFVRNKSYQGYSSLKTPSVETVDKFWQRVHSMNEHLLSGNVVDELIGNLVNMFYKNTDVSSEHRAQVISNIREDFIFNVHGKGSRNSVANRVDSDGFASPSKFRSFFSQFLFASDPNRGGRFWRDTPPALTQVIALMYHPRGDGGIENIYDKNPEQYLKNMRQLKIKTTDKQFIGAYGRKILGIYLALRFIKQDLSFIKLDGDNTSAKDKQKWHDLTKIHDELFESAGDLKDFLRHNASGFAQVIDSVKNHAIPDIKKTSGYSFNSDKAITKENYTIVAKKTLYPLMLNYTQFENFMGWHTRERGSSILYNTLKTQIFDRDVPDIVAGAATVMLLEGLDKISRRLQSINEFVGRDSNLSGIIIQITNKTKQGDINGAYNLFNRQIKRATNILDYENLFVNSKYFAFQREGLLWEQESFIPIIHDYSSENKNFFIGDQLAINSIEKNGKILTAKLVEAIKIQARLIKNIQAEMQEKNIKSPYDTQAMLKLSEYTRAASKEMTISFMEDHRDYLATLNDADSEKIFRDILKETHGLQELVGNVASVLATSEAVSYGRGNQNIIRDVKRNKNLENLVKGTIQVTADKPLSTFTEVKG